MTPKPITGPARVVVAPILRMNQLTVVVAKAAPEVELRPGVVAPRSGAARLENEAVVLQAYPPTALEEVPPHHRQRGKVLRGGIEGGGEALGQRLPHGGRGRGLLGEGDVLGRRGRRLDFGWGFTLGGRGAQNSGDRHEADEKGEAAKGIHIECGQGVAKRRLFEIMAELDAMARW